MILLTPQLHTALRAHAITRHAREQRSERFDPVPLVKLFNPIGAATWLATELAEDGDTLFGLADLGFGCPELGSFSLSEIASVRLPYDPAAYRAGVLLTLEPAAAGKLARLMAGVLRH